jgi:hypothetical protein
VIGVLPSSAPALSATAPIGVANLLGIVIQNEGSDAANPARAAGGAQAVVKVFEYRTG